jgi:protein-disulfide isomerase
MAAAEASECAADQGKFWEFLDYDYTHQDELSTSALEDWGKQLGLDTALYDRCRASHIKKKMIMAQESEGEGLGVQGTPTFFVNGKQVESTVDALGKAITDAQANAGKNL